MIQRVAAVLACVLAFSVLSPPDGASAQDAFSCIEELDDDQVLDQRGVLPLLLFP